MNIDIKISNSTYGFELNVNTNIIRPRGSNYEILKFGDNIAIKETTSNEVIAQSTHFSKWNNGIYTSVDIAIQNIENIIFLSSQLTSIDINNLLPKANSQEVIKLTSLSNSITISSKSISYLDVVILGINVTGLITISTASSTIEMDSNTFNKYYRNFNTFINKTNPHDITIIFNGESGYMLVEYSKI